MSRTRLLRRQIVALGLMLCALRPIATAAPLHAPPGAEPATPAANSNAMPAGEAGEQSFDETPIGHLSLAQQLFELARRHRDPVLALAALRLAASVESHPIERTPEVEPGATPAVVMSKGAHDSLGPPEVPEMTALARQLAADDAVLTAVLKAVGQPATSRGRVAGPGLTRGRIEAGAKVSFSGAQVAFRGGEPAQILLTGDGDSDLDLVVLDQFGNEVCRSDGPTDREYCNWTPRWTGSFKIIIINAGTVWSEFALRTN